MLDTVAWSTPYLSRDRPKTGTRGLSTCVGVSVENNSRTNACVAMSVHPIRNKHRTLGDVCGMHIYIRFFPRCANKQNYLHHSA